MARLASTVLVVALLAATATAFTLTQGLKLEQSPIFGTDVDKVFSPICGCESDRAKISFRLREADRVDVALIDSDGEIVATPVEGERFDRGRVVVRWDGLGADGQPLPEGEYRPRVRLREERRTTVLPNPIEIDLTAPRIVGTGVMPRIISPDGDRRADRLTVTYLLSEPARALLIVGGTKRVETRFPRERDTLAWFGRVDGRSVRPGAYPLQLRARDPAGNLGDAVQLAPVTVRYVSLGRERIVATGGTRFAIRVSSDARRIRWTLGRRSGFARPGTLRLRVPRQKGRYTLRVSANGHSASAAVFVREPLR
ncbi:MAG: FlgD immunoglobulin-like domain containing protein [Gaiellaceae bacterium]